MQKHMNIVVTDAYADELLKDLAEKNAIKILSQDDGIPEDNDIPEWQKAEVQRRIEAFNNNPDEGCTWEEIEKMLDEDAKM